MNDTIYRADAIEAVASADETNGTVKVFSGLEIIDMLKALPSADITETETCLMCQDVTDTILNRQGEEIKRLKASADDTFCKSQLITCNRVKECNGVCPFEDALKHADKADIEFVTQTMNEQTVIDHDREWIIGCLEHDGFIHTHRFDKANQIIHDALSAEAEPTVIRSRTLLPTKDFKKWAKRIREENPNAVVIPCDAEVVSADAVQGWILCSERLPKDLDPVNVTWVNHNPPCYYMDIMNVPFTGTCVRYKGKWYWWDSTICDVLEEYGEQCGADPIDKYIEVTAWQPLPTPYEGGEDE